MEYIEWDKLKLIVFDVDGTLYDQKKLRRKIIWKLCLYYIFRPHQFKALSVLYHFRIEREKRAGLCFNSLEMEQYEWCAKVTNQPVAFVRETIGRWMFQYPNRYLRTCMYPGVDEFLKTIENSGILKAVYSDYPAEEKCKAMQLDFDLLVNSTDQEINALKPSPKGLNHIIEQFGFCKNECLFIGDRYELDGKCAEAADIPFLFLDKREARRGLYIRLADQLNALRIVQD